MVYQNTYQVKTNFGEYRVVIELVKYADGTTRFNLIEADSYTPFARVSTNLGVPLKEDEIFVDTNNCKWAEDFLLDYKLAEPTGETEQSGYCAYPKYRLNMAQISKPLEL
jgi:hypothetical protein